jgi:hydroxyethylthiazole kinase-like uncharacterized protein yjeF
MLKNNKILNPKSCIRGLLVKRRPDSHKGNYGRALIVAGSSGMTGAAVLASRGALRAGAGLVYLAVPKELVNFVDTMTPEVITLPYEKIMDIKADAVAVGPGLGVSKQARNLISSFFKRSNFRSIPQVIDADALNIISKEIKLLNKVRKNPKIIMTPHPKEMSRLTKMNIEYIQKNRVHVAKEAAIRFKVNVVLKGHNTVITDKNGRVCVNTTGNPGMATAGVGDVLTGLMVGFLAQGIEAFEGAVLSVYLHGLAADLAAKEIGQYAMIATDILEKIPHAIQIIS